MPKSLHRWGGGASSFSSSFVLLVMIVIVAAIVDVEAQQSYVNNKQLDCENPASDTNSTRGFLCNGAYSSCKSYLTFRSTSTYHSPVEVAYLLGVNERSASLIASINNISSDVSTVPSDTLLIVPVDCYCNSSLYYQHNASYTLKDIDTKPETYFTVANDTYQGLTTCQALMAQNQYNFRNLSAGLSLHVPLRCACPTSNQTARGVNYLLTYLVTWGDSISSIAQLFGVNQQLVLDANRLSAEDVIFPFTPILVPLASAPNISFSGVSPPPPASPPPATPVNPVPDGDAKNKWKWVGIGIGGGGALLLLLLLSAFLFWRRSKTQTSSSQVPEPKAPAVISSSDGISKPWSHEFRYAVDSLNLYKFEDLQIATAHFGEANRIKESVYRGSFKGDVGVVKVLRGDVSAEINILKMINHSNIIRLSGFCVHQGNTYLVFEYAENGSLRDWLHMSPDNKKFQDQDASEAFSLSWTQRVQIAYDVADALSYLHNYTNPPYIHKNLKTSNVLLDAKLRAKVGNFGLARRLNDDHMQLTRHVVGTQGYLPPEYIENGLITPKMDVFAFGVVMLELISGKEAVIVIDKNDHRHQLLCEMIKTVLEGENVREKLRSFVDPCLVEEYPLDIAFSMAQLANTCVHSDLNARPSMPQVVMILSKILSSSLDWDPSDQLERSSSVLGHGR